MERAEAAAPQTASQRGPGGKSSLTVRSKHSRFTLKIVKNKGHCELKMVANRHSDLKIAKLVITNRTEIILIASSAIISSKCLWLLHIFGKMLTPGEVGPRVHREVRHHQRHRGRVHLLLRRLPLPQQLPRGWVSR